MRRRLRRLRRLRQFHRLLPGGRSQQLLPLLRHPLRQLRPLAAAYRAALNGTTADGRRPRAQPEREEADAKCVASLYRQRGRASPGPAK